VATVANTYARALADVVMSKRLDPAATLAEAQQIASLARENKGLREVWETPAISSEQKRAVLDAIARRAGLSQTVRNFVAVLIDHRRTRFLSEIVRQFATIPQLIQFPWERDQVTKKGRPILTDFERKYREEGRPIFYAGVRKE